MSDLHNIGDEVVLRLVGRIESSTVADGEVRVRLETGDLLDLTPEQLAAAVQAEQVRDLLLNHLLGGEPLGEYEVAQVAVARLCGEDQFDGVGGGLYRHVLLRRECE